MKRFIRSGPVQGLLAFLLWAYLDLILKTIRWTRINEAMVIDNMTGGKPAIGCFWHEFVPLSIAAKPAVRGKQTRIMISLSPDGEFVARAMVRHDMPAIRGSSGKKSDKGKAKGGVAAFREALEVLEQSGVVVIAPDGPRGPPRVMAAGAVSIARRSQAPVFFMGLAASPARRLNTWDRMVLPRLFGRGVILWDGPHFCPPDADEAAVAALCEAWGRRLTEVSEQAQARLS